MSHLFFHHHFRRFQFARRDVVDVRQRHLVRRARVFKQQLRRAELKRHFFSDFYDVFVFVVREEEEEGEKQRRARFRNEDARRERKKRERL